MKKMENHGESESKGERQVERKERGEETRKTEMSIAGEVGRNTKRPLGSTDNNRDCEGNHGQAIELEQITDNESEMLEQLSETFNAGLANTQRIVMLNYCQTERSFSDIMLTLRMNPASIKHHGDLLQASDLVRKTGEGKETRYKTTSLGRTLLSLGIHVLKAVRAP